MDTHRNQANATPFSVELRASKELVRLIVKLRWMGLEDAADCLESRVSSLKIPVADSVCNAPGETD
jgi:hypothetical protein